MPMPSENKPPTKQTKSRNTDLQFTERLPYFRYIFQGDHWGIFMIIALGFLTASLVIYGLKGGWITNILFTVMFGILLTWSILGWKRQ